MMDNLASNKFVFRNAKLLYFRDIKAQVAYYLRFFENRSRACEGQIVPKYGHLGLLVSLIFATFAPTGHCDFGSDDVEAAVAMPACLPA